jgi:hypothetical protein
LLFMMCWENSHKQIFAIYYIFELSVMFPDM